MRYPLLLILAILAAIALYLLTIATDESVILTSSSPPQEQESDYFMTDADTRQFSLDGSVQYRLLAKRLTHYLHPDTSELDAPEITIYQDSGPPWHISADHGKLSKDIALSLDKVELSDNVVVHIISEDGQPYDIYTEFLVIYPETKNMNTDHEVLLIATGSEITSLGMKANLAENEVTFLSNVRTRYEPQGPNN